MNQDPSNREPEWKRRYNKSIFNELKKGLTFNLNLAFVLPVVLAILGMLFLVVFMGAMILGLLAGILAAELNFRATLYKIREKDCSMVEWRTVRVLREYSTLGLMIWFLALGGFMVMIMVNAWLPAPWTAGVLAAIVPCMGLARWGWHIHVLRKSLRTLALGDPLVLRGVTIPNED